MTPANTGHSAYNQSTLTYPGGGKFARSKFVVHYNDSVIRPSFASLGLPVSAMGSNCPMVVCEEGTLSSRSQRQDGDLPQGPTRCRRTDAGSRSPQSLEGLGRLLPRRRETALDAVRYRLTHHPSLPSSRSRRRASRARSCVGTARTTASPITTWRTQRSSHGLTGKALLRHRWPLWRNQPCPRSRIFRIAQSACSAMSGSGIRGGLFQRGQVRGIPTFPSATQTLRRNPERFVRRTGICGRAPEILLRRERENPGDPNR